MKKCLMLALLVGGISTIAGPAHATDVGRLSTVFACLLYGLAAYMVWRGITAA